MAFQEFLYQYFVCPVANPVACGPFNVVNTVVYALIALAAIYLIYTKLLPALKIGVDEKFFYAIIPFILLGSVLRVWTDAGLLPRPWFVTPGIYVYTFLVLLAVLFVARFLEETKKIPLTKTMTWVGSVLALAAFLVIVPRLQRLDYAIGILFLSALAVSFFIYLSKWRKKHADNLEKITVFGQALDGAASFIGVQFAGYKGQHVVENLVFSSLGPIFFFLIKLAFVILLVEVIGSEFKQEQNPQLKNFVLLMITIFGLAPGTRDFLRIVAGV